MNGHAGRRIRQLLMGVIFYLFVSLPLRVEAAETPVVPSTESARYQANLKRWQSMTDEQREAIRQKAAAMSADERQVLQERLQRFQALSQAERKALREKYRRFRGLSPEKRQVLKERFQRFRSLPPARREELLRRFQEQRAARQKGVVPTEATRGNSPAGTVTRKKLSDTQYLERMKERRKKALENKKKQRKRKRVRNTS